MDGVYQRYSIENQAAAIAAYAACRGIDLVATYSDMGRSGLHLEGRNALKRLLEDVERGRTQFDCILVYDVSRWGRFQDVDESAYYEFICRRAGIQIHYCGDDFENNGTLASVVLKNIKRVAAADYSVQLSKKVFLGQSRTVSQGYWRGASAPYGMRRWLVDERGQPKIMLQFGDRKNLRTEHTTLRPGPKAEVKAVQRIFELFASRKMTRAEIAMEMNAKGLRNARGKYWNMQGIQLTLTNEAYVGHVVYNKRSQKFGERAILNPPEMWIRHDHAFEGIISPELFSRTQQVMAELRSGRIRTDESRRRDRPRWRQSDGRSREPSQRRAPRMWLRSREGRRPVHAFASHPSFRCRPLRRAWCLSAAGQERIQDRSCGRLAK